MKATKNTSINTGDRFIVADMSESVAIIDTNEDSESCLILIKVVPSYVTKKLIISKSKLLSFMIKGYYIRFAS